MISSVAPYRCIVIDLIICDIIIWITSSIITFIQVGMFEVKLLLEFRHVKWLAISEQFFILRDFIFLSSRRTPHVHYCRVYTSPCHESCEFWRSGVDHFLLYLFSWVPLHVVNRPGWEDHHRYRRFCHLIGK